MQGLVIAIAFVVGLAVGSFMTVVASRVPVKASIVHPRSACPRCGTPIADRDNIPVLGWVMLRGRCRSCSQPISPVYPAIELSTAVLVAAAWWVYAGDPWIAVPVSALLALLPAISVIDVQHQIIPNAIVYPALIVFPVYLVVAAAFGARVDLAGAVGGFMLYGGVLFVIALISRGMGMGDVKLAALIGVVLGGTGLSTVGVAAAAAIVLGGLGGVVALVSGAGRKAKIPFGPYLAAGAVVAAFWGPEISGWYGRSTGLS